MRPVRRVRARVPRLLAVLGLLAALAGGGLTVGAAPASATAQPMSKCTTTQGVVLAVDFRKWGGPLLRSCGTTPTTGYTLLNQGGWATTGTQHDGPAFICRIGYAGYQGGTQYPTAKDEPCVLTPPATAYWSYWHADPGQNTWSYSQLGAMSYHPKPGSVDLWIFGATNIAGTEGRPAFSPDTVRARNTAPGGTKTSAPAKPKPPAATRPATAPHPSATASGADTDPSPTIIGTPSAATLTPTPAATTAAPSTAAPVSSAAPQPQDAEPTAAAHHSSGSVLPVAITAGVVAVVAALIGVRVRQRRNAR
ncbi:hypothetical protein [Streptomyces sp. NPDC021020]|uniref:hypothetical protein n=1 Tax=Streptomyces sp. NPDC021020 TaxID=3365109 RepID=UPI0037954CCB